jgi:hypothetical protein
MNHDGWRPGRATLRMVSRQRRSWRVSIESGALDFRRRGDAAAGQAGAVSVAMSFCLYRVTVLVTHWFPGIGAGEEEGAEQLFLQKCSGFRKFYGGDSGNKYFYG